MKRFALVILCLLVACGEKPSDSGNTANSFPNNAEEAPPNSSQLLPPIKLALKGSINTFLMSNPKVGTPINNTGVITSKWIRFFGEIINNGKTSACGSISIKSTVSLRSPGESDLSDTQTSQIYGVNLTGSNLNAASCLRPGEFGAFQVDSHHTRGTTLEPVPSLDLPSSISWTIHGVNDHIVEPKVPASDVVLIGPLTVGSDSNGNVTIDGTIKNNNHSLKIFRPQVIIVALNKDMVIGVMYPGYIRNECRRTPSLDGLFSSDDCLRPDESFNFFWVLPNVKASEMTDFHYKIAYTNWEEN